MKSYINCGMSLYMLKRIGGVMVSMRASHAGDRGLNPDRVKPKTLKLVFAASPSSTQH